MFQYLQSKSIIRAIYFLGIALFVIGLPFSKAFVSIAQFILIGAWLLEPNWKQKINTLKNNNLSLGLIALWLLHIVGFLYTTDFAYAIRDARIKLPLLLLPLILGSTQIINATHKNTILKGFVVVVSAAAFYSIAKFIFLSGGPQNRRELSEFISHIRFSLELCLAVYITPYLAIKSKLKTEQFALITLFALNLVTLFLLNAFTGISLFIMALLPAIFYLGKSTSNNKLKLIFIGAPTLIVIAASFIIGKVAYQFYVPENPKANEILDFTPRGEFYAQIPNDFILENGYKFGRNVAWNELKTSWNSVSSLKFDSVNQHGHHVSATLIRYLTSKGLPKDYDAVQSLTQQEINWIENGITNYKMVHANAFEKRLYELFWEVRNYHYKGNPEANSFTMRLEFWRNGLQILKQNWLFGVGTGDVQLAFNKQYESTNSNLKHEYRLRSHNQYLTLFITFGVIGFVLFLVIILTPIGLAIKNSNYVQFIVALLLAFSMLNEDTLETQIGVSIFTFMYTIALILPFKKSHV